VAPDADGNVEVFIKDLETGNVVQMTNVQRPREYRLPKYTPGGKIVATGRDTQTSDEELDEVTGSNTSTLVENGSGGTVQPLGRCFCDRLAVRVADATREIGERKGKQVAVVRIEVRWALSCGPGVGGCKSALAAIPAERPDALVYDKARKEILCKGPCDRATEDVDTFVGVGNPSRFAFSIFLGAGCFKEVSIPRKYRLAFTRTGDLDRANSDLVGVHSP
jgi:hypothetical protein